MKRRPKNHPSLGLGPEYQDQDPRSPGYLIKPFTPAERRNCDRLYKANIGLVKLFKDRLSKKFRYMLDPESVDSCVDIAFLKAFRTWDRERFKLSTWLGVLAEGEVRHYLRDANWSVSAPGEVRQLGLSARQKLATQMTVNEVAAELGSTPSAIRDAIQATAGVMHDIKGFDLHAADVPCLLDQMAEAEEKAARDAERLRIREQEALAAT